MLCVCSGFTLMMMSPAAAIVAPGKKNQTLGRYTAHSSRTTKLAEGGNLIQPRPALDAISNLTPPQDKSRDIPLDFSCKGSMCGGDGQTVDLCSEHAKRPASAPGLWWCKGSIVGIGSGGQWWKSPVIDLSGAVAARPTPIQIARRRVHLTPWTTPVSMSFAANGDGFIGASRQGSVVTC
jgi:hypothetical protein